MYLKLSLNALRAAALCPFSPYSTSAHLSLRVASHIPYHTRTKDGFAVNKLQEPTSGAKQTLKIMFTPTSNSKHQETIRSAKTSLFDSVAGVLHQAEEHFAAEIRSSCQEQTFLRPQYTKVHFLTRCGN